MDNLNAHKAPEVIAAIELAGASEWHLPPYSPDFNPIEPMWSRVKSILQSLKALTAEALLDAIGVALRTVTAADAHGWFAHCGYRNTESLTALVGAHLLRSSEFLLGHLLDDLAVLHQDIATLVSMLSDFNTFHRGSIGSSVNSRSRLIAYFPV
jgi:hypothetical protein